MKSGIYWIVSPSGRCYVGSSRQVQRRLDAHKSMLRRGVHPNTPLQNAAHKYGLDNLHFGVLEKCATELLIEREQYFIDSLGFRMLYNIRPQAESNAGFKASDATRAKLSVQRAFEWAAGLRDRMHSETARAKIAAALARRTPEQRKAQGDKLRGRKHSEAHKAAISAGNMGREFTPITRKVIGDKVSAAKNTSGYKGVSFDKRLGKWAAYAQLDGRKRNFGQHATRDLAYSWRLVMLAHVEYANG